MVCQGFKGGKEFTDIPLESGFEPSLSADDSIISGGGERVRVGTGGLRPRVQKENNEYNCDGNSEDPTGLCPSIVPFVLCGDLSGYFPRISTPLISLLVTSHRASNITFRSYPLPLLFPGISRDGQLS